MKILFLCGSLEPGRDGVGDYTRRIAGELIKLGNQVTLVALNDKYVEGNIVEIQYSEKIEIQVFRISSKSKKSKKQNCASLWVEKNNPQLVSIQFVIYSFHPMGLPRGIEGFFKKICNLRKVHFMFHEIWIGFTKISPIKHRFIGFFQKRIIKNLINALRPSLITTTNALYQSILKKENIVANILPLFSNIEIAEPNQSIIKEIWNSLHISPEDRQRCHIVGVFGNIHPSAKLEKTINSQLALANEVNKQLIFIGLGRTDEVGKNEFCRLNKLYSNSVIFHHFGDLPSEYISNLFQILDLGISCTPKQHIGKSGVFAAMRHHSLNVLIPNEEYIPEYNTEIRNYYNEIINRPAMAWSASNVSIQFVSLLK